MMNKKEMGKTMKLVDRIVIEQEKIFKRVGELVAMFSDETLSRNDLYIVIDELDKLEKKMDANQMRLYEIEKEINKHNEEVDREMYDYVEIRIG